ncbi:FliI/YscN family ATPase [Entomospira nematocerorum]|uniref:FliI/YscN family ATPase n=1 Tax=Entomospira nematocerorum TaxID=2719987 RepID=A0A968KYC7_9SPIO|nr:FliI/YscN family ATPase [Entomospira nematocera]NIZ47447.1 FliI/YscN family ATPase [Entomospira nematocera]WDI34015.1 FliI/YscN family ATPase [Entomospira nematocera]
MNLLDKYREHIEEFNPIRSLGTINKIKGVMLESLGPQMYIGEVAKIYTADGKSVLAEATGSHNHYNNLMPYEDLNMMQVGARVKALGGSLSIPVGDMLLGRVLDGLGRPYDDKGPIHADKMMSVFGNPPNAMERKPVNEQVQTGIRAIDGLLPLGNGQRIGIFAGSGVGKSTLLGMIARNSDADVNVIALIGERGREVREFIENELGEEGLARSVLIVSTSDTPPLARVRGAYVATTIAEYFRDQGRNVMLLFDSVTRFALAQRDVGLANGELPATRGYPASVFTLLPKLLERSGTSKKGSITGIYTVLVEGDDMDEPIADAVRGYLDGHIVLARSLAEMGHFPAIDVLKSVSRLAPKLQDGTQMQATLGLRKLLAAAHNVEDLVKVGAYVKGSDPLVDEALHKRDSIEKFLQQSIDESAILEHSLKSVKLLASNVARDR